MISLRVLIILVQNLWILVCSLSSICINFCSWVAHHSGLVPWSKGLIFWLPTLFRKRISNWLLPSFKERFLFFGVFAQKILSLPDSTGVLQISIRGLIAIRL